MLKLIKTLFYSNNIFIFVLRKEAIKQPKKNLNKMKNQENVIIGTVVLIAITIVATAFILKSFLPVGLLVVVGLGFTVSSEK
jgi:hypothetical protein